LQGKDGYGMQVLQIKSKKGGVGKSLFAREFAQTLAALGCNVTLIDCSEQANDDILENQQRLFSYTLKECIIGGVPIRNAVRQVRKHLWLLAGSRDHEDINTFIRKERYQGLVCDLMDDFGATLSLAPSFEERFGWWYQPRVGMSTFHSEVTTVEEFSTPPQYMDYVIIDSDASTEDDLTFVLWDAITGILIPYELTELDWQSYYQLKQDLDKRYHRRPQQKPPIIGILPNKVLHTKDNPTPMVYLKAIYRDAPEHVFQPVHWSKIFGECLNQHIGSLDHPSATTDRAVRELCTISLEIIGYQGELAGLKFCDKCTEALNQAMQEQQERAV
jgi:cellulose biosynthesis protein BcsQ